MDHGHLRLGVMYLSFVRDSNGHANIRLISEHVGLSVETIRSLTKYYAAHGIVAYRSDDTNTRRARITSKGVVFLDYLKAALDALTIEKDFKSGLEVEGRG